MAEEKGIAKSKSILYTNDDLEKLDNGKYKCPSCPYNSITIGHVLMHVFCTHPQYSHYKRVANKNNFSKNMHLGVNNWTTEELGNPYKKLHYTITNLEKKEGKFKCFCCSYDSTNKREVIVHISSQHPRFVLIKNRHLRKSNKNEIMYPRLGIKTWTQEEFTDPEKKLFFTNGDVGKIDRKFKCFVCTHSSANLENVVRHITFHHQRFEEVHFQYIPNMVVQRCVENSNDIDTSDVNKNVETTRNEIERWNSKRKTSPLKPSPVRHSLRIKKSIDYAQTRTTSDSSFCVSIDEELMDRDDTHSANETIENDQIEEKVAEVNCDDLSKKKKHTIDGVHVHGADIPNNTYAVFEDTSEVGATPDLTRSEESLDNNSFELCARGLHPRGGEATMKGIPVQMDINENSSDNISISYKLNEQNRDEHNTPNIYPDIIQIDSDEETDEGRENEKDRIYVDASCKLRLNQLLIANEYLAASIESLTTKHENEIAKLKEELSKKNEVDMNQLLNVKEEMLNAITGSHLTSGHQEESTRIRGTEVDKKKLIDFEIAIATKEKENENLKSEIEEMRNLLKCEREFEKIWEAISKQHEEELRKELEELRKKNIESKVEEMRAELVCEREKAKEWKHREEELVKKLADAEYKVGKFQKLFKLRDEQEKLRLQEELEEQRMNRILQEAETAKQVMKETKRAKEERLRELERIQDELFIRL